MSGKNGIVVLFTVFMYESFPFGRSNTSFMYFIYILEWEIRTSMRIVLRLRMYINMETISKENVLTGLYDHRSFYWWLYRNKIKLFSFLLKNRTKWKRQTAVGLELLAEAGNYATLQRLYAGSAAAAAAAGSPYPWGYPSGPHLGALPTSKFKLFIRINFIF